MTDPVRPLDEKELITVQWMLRVGLLEGLGLWKRLSGGYEYVAERILGATAGEALLEEDTRLMLELPSAHAQRVQVFVAPSAADLAPKLLGFREEILGRIKAKDGSLPDENGVVMTVDLATAGDALRQPLRMRLEDMARWLGRLLVRRAVFGAKYMLLLEFGRDLGPEEWIAVGAGLRPAEWHVQWRRVLLYCYK
ncbi:hypothetical protein [Thermoflexus sp.]|uniref:hypothetical protein n=1 Tax=Thermoflexus sp. TaxID=1969742 RepID=UPI003BFD195F